MSESATTQNATGSARGQYDKVSFQIRVEGRGNTGPQAKSRAQESVSNLRNTIAELEEGDVKFEKDDNVASFDVQQEQRYDESAGRHVPSGYLATFTMHLVTKQVDRAADVMDALTSGDGLNVSSPNFSVCSEKKRELQRTALNNAWQMAKQRFEEECSVLRLNSDDFEVSDWNTRYSDDEGGHPRAQMYAMAAQADMADDANGAGPLVQSGAATVSVTLSVGFRRK